MVQRFRLDPGMRGLWQAISEAREDLGPLLDVAGEQEREALRPIARYLEDCAAAGRIIVDDADVTAAIFADLIGGGLTGFITPLPQPEEQQRRSELAIRFFLRAIQAA